MTLENSQAMGWIQSMKSADSRASDFSFRSASCVSLIKSPPQVPESASVKCWWKLPLLKHFLFATLCWCLYTSSHLTSMKCLLDYVHFTDWAQAGYRSCSGSSHYMEGRQDAHLLSPCTFHGFFCKDSLALGDYWKVQTDFWAAPMVESEQWMEFRGRQI